MIEVSQWPPSLATLTNTGPASYLIDFGTVAIGQESAAQMGFENLGDSSLTFLSIGPPSDAEFEITLAEGSSLESGVTMGIPFSFKPFSSGPKSATIVIQSDAATPTVTLTLSGSGVNGTLSVLPQVVDFGSVAVHSVASRVVSIANDYPVDLTITPWVGGGPAASAYSLNVAPGAQFTVHAGTSRTIAVDYTPLVPSATDTGLLGISSNVGENVTVGLRGMAR
jgi:hypothetical protein